MIAIIITMTYFLDVYKKRRKEVNIEIKSERIINNNKTKLK
jgi:hypothetical protein